MYNKHIREDLGKRLVTAIRENDVKNFYIKMLGEEGLSISYVEHMANVIEPVLELAVKEGLIDINPARGVQISLKTDCVNINHSIRVKPGFQIIKI